MIIAAPTNSLQNSSGKYTKKWQTNTKNNMKILLLFTTRSLTNPNIDMTKKT